jgi:hypothetical protein
MNFDTFLATVNGWGHYQKVKFIFVCLTYMVPPIMVYTWSFTAAIPEFQCRHPYSDISSHLSNDLYQPTEDQCKLHQKLISIKECQRCYRRSEPSNISHLEICDSYVFNRSIYKKTLVEEVSFFDKLFQISNGKLYNKMRGLFSSGRWCVIALSIDLLFR